MEGDKPTYEGCWYEFDLTVNQATPNPVQHAQIYTKGNFTHRPKPITMKSKAHQKSSKCSIVVNMIPIVQLIGHQTCWKVEVDHVERQ